MSCFACIYDSRCDAIAAFTNRKCWIDAVVITDTIATLAFNYTSLSFVADFAFSTWIGCGVAKIVAAVITAVAGVETVNVRGAEVSFNAIA